ncbi:hypothetical protein [Micromonospora sp. NPDC051296]|uniref:hypothetical protein n=1 Tax=Micromonospora sp. NPDC051296 TaxID=3155046 RepID=UPI003448EE9F
MVTMAAGRPAREDAPPVRLEELHGALLLHAGTSRASALRAVTTALARAHPETVVVTSPAVTGRADVFGLVAEALDRTPPARPAVRLVLIGAGPDRAARIAGIGEIAVRLGRPVTGPLGRVTVASDGTCVSVAEPATPDDLVDGPPGWHTRTGVGDGHDESPWSPAPAWPETPTPQRWQGPGVVARPVPAGLWLLPPGVAADVSGVVAGLPREPDAATLLVGGCGRPVEVDDLVAAVAALRPDPATRLVLLPGALPAGAGLGALAELPVRLRCAVPVKTGTGRRLAPVTADGVVLPIDAIAAPPEPSGRAEPDGAPPVPEPAAAGRGPRTSGPVAGRPTAAGWSFLPGGSPPFGFVAAIATTVIEVASGRRGFIVDGAPVGAVKLADLLLAAGTPARVPLVVVDPDRAIRAPLLANLAAAWGATVYAPSGPAALTVSGALLASGGFTAYSPGTAARAVGPVLPTACADALAALATRMTPPPPDGRRTYRRRTGWRINGHHQRGEGEVHAPGNLDPSLASPEATAQGRAAVPVADPDRRLDDAPPPGDLAATVARALGPDYARFAEEVGAGHPGTRDDGESAGADPALIALRAWAGGDPVGVDAHLRGSRAEQGEPEGPWRPAPAVLGAAAALALTRMPLVFGPVFAASDGPDSGYAPGMELVEPGFVRARLTPATRTAGGLTYVIWSASGRHLDGGFGDAPACVFVPGSRFQVLGVDRDAGHPTVVYLADQAADRQFDVEGLLSRLRAARTDRTESPTAEAQPVARPAGALIGLADGGRPYPVTTPG